MRIGFVGTGRMGKPMARNLLRAGFTLAVHDRNAAALAELVAAGAGAPGNSRALAEQSDVVITSLVDWQATREVVFGPAGLREGLRPGSLYIDMGTESPGNAIELARVLDAAVSGGEQGAIGGTLAIMAGGSPAAFERARPIFAVLGSSAVRIGGPGAGQIAKAANQIIVAGTIELVAEAFALARAYGVDPAVVRDAIRGGFAASAVLEQHGRRMLERDFAPGGAISGHMKDRANVLEACAETRVELPVARAVFERVREVVERGGGDLDQSALYTLYDGLAPSPAVHGGFTPPG